MFGSSHYRCTQKEVRGKNRNPTGKVSEKSVNDYAIKHKKGIPH